MRAASWQRFRVWSAHAKSTILSAAKTRRARTFDRRLDKYRGRGLSNRLERAPLLPVDGQQCAARLVDLKRSVPVQSQPESSTASNRRRRPRERRRILWSKGCSGSCWRSVTGYFRDS